MKKRRTWIGGSKVKRSGATYKDTGLFLFLEAMLFQDLTFTLIEGALLSNGRGFGEGATVAGFGTDVACTAATRRENLMNRAGVSVQSMHR